MINALQRSENIDRTSQEDATDGFRRKANFWSWIQRLLEKRKVKGTKKSVHFVPDTQN